MLCKNDRKRDVVGRGLTIVTKTRTRKDGTSDSEVNKKEVEEFPDEEADDFDYDAKSERFEKEKQRCQIRTIEAYK